jgi:prophage tail gpP-like protein
VSQALLFPADTDLELVAAGVSYTGWSEVNIERGLDACCSRFTLTCPERFLPQTAPLPLKKFTPCVLRYNGVTLLTGYIFSYKASFSPSAHDAVITGRSLTAQLVDCTPDIPAGQYQGYTLAAIAAAVCAIFGLSAKTETDLAGSALADATLERGETAFAFIDRLATICGVLAYDDETGALVLGNAGASRATGALVQGHNIESGSVEDNGEEEFSIYIAKGQSGIAAAAGASGFPSGAGDAEAGDDSVTALTAPPVGAVLTQQRATAIDPSVPIYRPKVILAEGQLTQAQLQLRANWQRSYHYGQALKANATVPGWVQPDGTPWQINTIVPVDAPALAANEDLLILKVNYRYTLGSGRQTEISIGPVDGAIPSPSLLKNRRRRRNGGTALQWSGVIPG